MEEPDAGARHRAVLHVSFLIRTLSWKLILGDDGWVTSTFNALHLTDLFAAVGLTDGQPARLPLAVVTGLTYNFLPFMVLPLYACSRRSTRG